MFKTITATLLGLSLLAPIAPITVFAADDTTPMKADTTKPKIVSPEVMKQNASIAAMQTKMNSYLTQKDNLNTAINKLQQDIDAATKVRDTLSK
jgi:hypothetical protein